MIEHWNYPRQLGLCMLALLPLTACSEHTSESSTSSAVAQIAPTPAAAQEQVDASAPHEVRLLDNGDIFVFASERKFGTTASYFFTRAVDAEEKFQRIVWILEQTGAEKGFLNLVKQRVANNRRLKKDSFTLPLTDPAGNVHEFRFIADILQQKFRLHYSKDPS